MEFNQRCLDTLLSLPCVIDETKILTETPIFATAEKIDNTVYLLYVNKGESLSEFLRRVYQGDGPYHMDCSVYSQLVSKVLSDKWPTDGGELLLFIDTGVGGFMLWEEKIPQMGYITASDIYLNKYLCRMATSCKGQWCVKTSQDQYLGLSKNGPRVLSLSSWASLLRSGLFSYLENEISCSYADPLTRTLLYLYAKTGKIDSWGIFYEKGICDTIVQCASDGRFDSSCIIVRPGSLYPRCHILPIGFDSMWNTDRPPFAFRYFFNDEAAHTAAQVNTDSGTATRPTQPVLKDAKKPKHHRATYSDKNKHMRPVYRPTYKCKNPYR